MWTKKCQSLYTQGNWCVNTTLFDYVHGTGFSCVRLCQEFLLVEKVTF